MCGKIEYFEGAISNMYILRILCKIDEYFHYLLQYFSQSTYWTLFFKVVSDFLGPIAYMGSYIQSSVFLKYLPSIVTPPFLQDHVSPSTSPSTNSLSVLEILQATMDISKALTQSFLTLQMLNTIITHFFNRIVVDNQSVNCCLHSMIKLCEASRISRELWNSKVIWQPLQGWTNTIIGIKCGSELKLVCNVDYSGLRVWDLGPVDTMDHEVRPWKLAFFHGPNWWSNFHGPLFVFFGKKTNFQSFWAPH